VESQDGGDQQKASDGVLHVKKLVDTVVTDNQPGTIPSIYTLVHSDTETINDE